MSVDPINLAAFLGMALPDLLAFLLHECKFGRVALCQPFSHGKGEHLNQQAAMLGVGVVLELVEILSYFQHVKLANHVSKATDPDALRAYALSSAARAAYDAANAAGRRCTELGSRCYEAPIKQ